MLKTFTQSVDSAQGSFTQTMLDKDGKTLDVPSTGSFKFERPGKFVWSIAKPYPQDIVSNGQTLWIWDPDLNQVTVKRLTASVSTTPAAVLFGKGNIDEYFALKDLASKEGIYWVQATPKVEDLTYRVIEIGFNEKGLIAAMRLEDHFGQTTKLDFKDVATKTAFDAQVFNFKIPEGADVLRDDN